MVSGVVCLNTDIYILQARPSTAEPGASTRPIVETPDPDVSAPPPFSCSGNSLLILRPLSEVREKHAKTYLE